MHLRFFFFLTAAFLAFKVSAQHYISLEQQQIDLSELSFQVVEVMDAREQKGDIGWAQKGFLNEKNFVYFSKPFKQELLDLIKKSELEREESVFLALAIHDLKVSELTTAVSETGKAEISLSIYIKKDTNQYYFVKKVYAFEEHGGMDVTRKHPENIAKALEKGLHSITRSDIQEALHKKEPLTRDHIIEQHDSELAGNNFQPKIFLTENYEDGVFVTFDEFLNNKPSIKWFEVKGGSYKANLWVENEYGEKRLVKEGVYGVASNNSLFVLFHKHFYHVYKRNDSFYFMGPRIPDKNAVIAGSILGGAIGGAIAASTSGERKEYKINLETGSIYEEGEFSNPTFTAKVIFYRRAKREREKELILMMGDSLIATVKPNQFGEFEVPVQEVTVCLDEISCVTFVPYTHEVNYLSCSFPEKGKDPQVLISREEKKVGEFYVREIQNLQAK